VSSSSLGGMRVVGGAPSAATDGRPECQKCRVHPKTNRVCVRLLVLSSSLYYYYYIVFRKYDVYGSVDHGLLFIMYIYTIRDIHGLQYAA